MTRPFLAVLVAVAVAVAVGVAACGREGEKARSTCGPAVEEPLDPASTRHLLPGAPEPRYSSDPPTSGPHAGGPPPTGVQDQPLSRPVQVGVLETGAVLVQHRGVPGSELRQLESLAGEKVVVALNPSLPAPVVATAWRHRMECRGVDLDALNAFIGEHRGSGGHP